MSVRGGAFDSAAADLTFAARGGFGFDMETLDPQVQKGSGLTFDAATVRLSEYQSLLALADAFKDNLDSTYDTLKEKWQDKIDISDNHNFVWFDAYKRQSIGRCGILATPPGFRPSTFEEANPSGKHVFRKACRWWIFLVYNKLSRALLKLKRKKNWNVS
ncbi:hypothetical protein FQA39_LY19390 [Lamprigera yunnana]|nr:hypothetical protein FQA39_LY19390 [Lamprigera yunnana]